MLKLWLKIAVENHRRNLLTTAVNLFGLVLGFAGFMLVLLLWNFEKSYEQWNPYKKDIYYLQQHYTNESWTNNNISYSIAEMARRNLPEVEDYLLFAYDNRYGMLETPEGRKKYTDNGQTVSENFFNFFPFKLKFGRYKDALSDKKKIAISDSISSALFGNENPVGKQIIFQDDQKLTVSAVYFLPKTKTSVKPDYLLLSRMLIDDRENVKNGFPNWGNNSYQGLIKLKKSSNPDLLEKKLFSTFVQKKYTPEFISRTHRSAKEDLEKVGPNRFYLTRLDKVRTEAKAVFRGHADSRNIRIMFGLSVLILVLSIINVINLKTAQASGRAKEVGVKKAIGISTKSIAFHLILENLVLCFAAYFIALAVVEGALPYFSRFLDKDIQLFYPKAYMVSVAVVIGAALLSGILPALYISGFAPIKTLKGNFSRSARGIWLRNAILVLQLAISSFFISAGIVVYQQVKFLMNRDLGFSGDQVALISYQNSVHDFKKYRKVKSELKRIKGVKDVSFGEASPLLGESSSSIVFRDKTLTAVHGSMDFNFFRFFSIKLLAGREFSPKIKGDTLHNIVVNEAFALAMGLKNSDILNKKVMAGFSDDSLSIVGVVKNYSLNDAAYKTLPVVFFINNSVGWKGNYVYNTLVKIDKNDVPQTVKRLKIYWNKIEPGYPFHLEFIDDGYKMIYDGYQKQVSIVGILTILVILVAVMGLFALASLLLSQQKKDLSIKSAIGASPKFLSKEFTRRFIPIVLFAVGLSVPVSYLILIRWLNTFDYHISIGFLPFLISGVTVSLMTLAIVSVKAFLQTKNSLAGDLKYE